jgi:hypothetical protein
MNQKAVGRISTPRTVSRLSLLMRRRPGDFQAGPMKILNLANMAILTNKAPLEVR